MSILAVAHTLLCSLSAYPASQFMSGQCLISSTVAGSHSSSTAIFSCGHSSPLCSPRLHLQDAPGPPAICQVKLMLPDLAIAGGKHIYYAVSSYESCVKCHHMDTLHWWFGCCNADVNVPLVTSSHASLSSYSSQSRLAARACACTQKVS